MEEMVLVPGRDLVIRMVTLPEHVHGFCTIDEDGTGNVYINEKDPEERQMKAIKHEVLHLVRNDLYRNQDFAEEEVDKTLDNYEIEIKPDILILRKIG